MEQVVVITATCGIEVSVQTAKKIEKIGAECERVPPLQRLISSKINLGLPEHSVPSNHRNRSHSFLIFTLIRMDLALDQIVPEDSVIITFHFSCRCQVLSDESVEVMRSSFWYWFHEMNQILLSLPDHSVLYANKGQYRDYFTICQCTRLLSQPFDLRLLFNHIGLGGAALLYVNVDTMIYNRLLLQSCYDFVWDEGLLQAEDTLSIIGNFLRVQNVTGLHISTYPIP